MVALLFPLAATLPAEDVLAKETWQAVLKIQLMKEQRCDLNYMTRLREFELANHQVIEGRAHCTDGREFDVVRRKTHLKFDIKLCQPTLC